MRPHSRTRNQVQVMEAPPLSPQMMEVGEVTPQHQPYGCEYNNKRRRPVKHVTFAEEALSYRSNRTLQDVEHSWYNKTELATFKNERREMIRRLKKANFDLSLIDQERICLRGYEPYFSVAMNKATKYARELVMSVVFVEQGRQRMLGVFDPESLRERSCQASQWSRDTGVELGITDGKLNPLRIERLGQTLQESDFINGAQLRIAKVDDNTVRQLESTLDKMKSMLVQCAP